YRRRPKGYSASDMAIREGSKLGRDCRAPRPLLPNSGIRGEEMVPKATQAPQPVPYDSRGDCMTKPSSQPREPEHIDPAPNGTPGVTREAPEVADPSHWNMLSELWSNETLTKLTTWLEEGRDLTRLGQLLKAEPILIAHPLVFRELVRRDLLHRWTKDEFDSSNEDVGEGDELCVVKLENIVVIPTPKHPRTSAVSDCPDLEVADTQLRQLVTAWVEGGR